ncbi:SpvB/TcaC N-terminal domain-containing protein [Streptomyces sp. NPDC006879]|uniref:SpvB/TcaC N-terminal domain-containing protein n=1 Tax=Streptomyces sp. NPDC006879 TaxID=3364767 RepID=UPI0036B030F1
MTAAALAVSGVNLIALPTTGAAWAAPAPETPPGVPGGKQLDEPSAMSQGANAGYLPGSLNVSSTGTASYTVALKVPDGPGGLRPSLALAYSSGAGSGIAGVGWSISGLSGISRCGKTFATDGKQTGVHFRDADAGGEDADQYCLDGQRLVAVKNKDGIQGAYGASDTEYRTEKETFTKIVSKDADASGPGWFEVRTGDGHTREYRPQTASRRSGRDEAGKDQYATVRVSWPISKESDSSGNTLAYAYSTAESAINGVPTAETVIDQISYSIPAGKTRARYIKFDYQKSRPDKSFSWRAGVRTSREKRLKTIAVYGPNPSTTSLLWTYELDYGDASPVTGRSLLRSVKQCGHKGGCLKAKTFDYSDRERDRPDFTAKTVARGFTPSTSAATLGARRNGRGMQPADFDGDGADDLVVLRDDINESYVLLGERKADGSVRPLSKKVSFAPLSDTSDTFTSEVKGLTPVDVDGDGVTELVKTSVEKMRDPEAGGTSHVRMSVWRWNSAKDRFDRSTDTFSGGTEDDELSPRKFGDVDGDGLVDLIASGRLQDDATNGGRGTGYPGPHPGRNGLWGDEWHIHLNKGGRFDLSDYLKTTVRADGYVYDDDVAAGMYRRQPGMFDQMIDLDGDGRAEADAEDDREIRDGFFEYGQQKPLRIRDDGTVVFGLECEAQNRCASRDGYDGRFPHQTLIGDFNGDGLSDKAWFGLADNGAGGFQPSDIKVRYGTGTGFSAEETFAHTPIWNTDGMKLKAKAHVGDVDGDGRSDVLVFHKSPLAGAGELHEGITIFTAAGRTISLPGAATSSPAADPAEAWQMSTVGDFNGDGRTDLLTFNATSDGEGSDRLVVLENHGPTPDLLTDVTDEDSAWPRESISYSTEWSNQPRALPVPQYAFPTVAVRRRDMPVVRRVLSRGHIVDIDSYTERNTRAHVSEYSYEYPVMDVQGRGFLGFDQTSVWEPQRLSEKITTYDNHVRGGLDRPGDAPDGAFYPFVGLPKDVITVTPITGEFKQDKSGKFANARITRTVNAYEPVIDHDGRTFYTRSKNTQLPGSHNTVASEWEGPVAIDWDLDKDENPLPRAHLFGFRRPDLSTDDGRVTRSTYRSSERDEYGNLVGAQRASYGPTSADRGVAEKTHTWYDHAQARIDAWQLHLPTTTTTTRIEPDDTPSKPHRTERRLDFMHDARGLQTDVITEQADHDSLTAAQNADLRRHEKTDYGTHGEITSEPFPTWF